MVIVTSACSTRPRPIHDYTSRESDPIREELMKTVPDLRQCYKDEMKRIGKDLSASVKLYFTIGSEGQVTTSHVEELSEEKLSNKLHTCFNKVLSQMEFPRPMSGGVVDVKQPMNFFPKEN